MEEREGEADKCVVQSEHRTVALRCPRQNILFSYDGFTLTFKAKENRKKGKTVNY